MLAEQRFVEQECKYSHIPMTVNQESLLNTKHVQEQCSEITLSMFGSVHKRHRQNHTPTTTKKGWRFALMPPWASRHIGGSWQGHPRYTDAREGWPWVAHNTIQSATNVHNQETGTTISSNVHQIELISHILHDQICLTIQIELISHILHDQILSIIQIELISHILWIRLD